MNLSFDKCQGYVGQIYFDMYVNRKRPAFRSKILRVFLLFSFVISLVSYQTSFGMSGRISASEIKDINALVDSVYLEIREVSLKISTYCPPKSCMIVGLGRSPTPILEFLNLLFKDYTIALPLSSFRYSSRELKQEHIDKLDLYFDKMLGSTSAVRKEKILLLDYANTGESLYSADYFVSKYMQRFGVKVEAFALIDNYANTVKKAFRSISLRGDRASLGTYKFLELPYELQSNIFSQVFDPYAEYQYYNPLKSFGPFKNAGKERDVFLKRLKTRVLKDKDLARLLQSNFEEMGAQSKDFKCSELFNQLPIRSK